MKINNKFKYKLKILYFCVKTIFKIEGASSQIFIKN